MADFRHNNDAGTRFPAEDKIAIIAAHASATGRAAFCARTR
jgi:hypothetical protein